MYKFRGIFRNSISKFYFTGYFGRNLNFKQVSKCFIYCIKIHLDYFLTF